MSERPPKPEAPRVQLCRDDCPVVVAWLNADGSKEYTPQYLAWARKRLVACWIAFVIVVALLVFVLLTAPAAAAECRHIRVLDGDTLVADIALGFDVVLAQQTIRIHGYDAWETSYRRQTIVFAKDELAKGALAKAALEKLLTGKVTVLEVAGRDPYGRRLLEVYADGVNVGETLRAQGHERTEKRLSTLKND